MPPAIPAAGAAPPEEVHARDPAQVDALKRVMASEHFRDLERLWRQIDSVELDPDSLDSYRYLPMERTRADSLLARLDRLEEALRPDSMDPGPVRTALASVLDLTRERISVLSRMRTSTMTRMMPPWTMTARENTSREFERRLETLERRRAAGDINGAEAGAALDTIVHRMHAWTVLGAVNECYGGGWMPHYPHPEDSSDVLTTAMTLVEARHRAAADTLAKYPPDGAPEHYRTEPGAHRRLMEALERHERALPYMRVMLEYLLD
jgi:hypothetical protein